MRGDGRGSVGADAAAFPSGSSPSVELFSIKQAPRTYNPTIDKPHRTNTAGQLLRASMKVLKLEVGCSASILSLSLCA
jgi:hypothetical protein